MQDEARPVQRRVIIDNQVLVEIIQEFSTMQGVSASLSPPKPFSRANHI